MSKWLRVCTLKLISVNAKYCTLKVHEFRARNILAVFPQTCLVDIDGQFETKQSGHSPLYT